MSRVYISGSITNGGKVTDPGEIQHNKCRFDVAAARLHKAGYEPVNPAHIEVASIEVLQGTEWVWRGYMRECLRLLLDCDSIYMLDGWQRSDGAEFERVVARKLGMPVIYEHEGVI